MPEPRARTSAALQDAAPASAEESELRRAVELLFYAYRDFTADPDAILADYGFGRAHHRAVYFVGRAPGTTVSDLLGTLRITKQSLARVLNQLLAEGFLVQRTDGTDKRRRRLYLTAKGRELEAKLSGVQFDRIRRAFAEAGADAAPAFAAVLKAMIDAPDKERF